METLATVIGDPRTLNASTLSRPAAYDAPPAAAPGRHGRIDDIELLRAFAILLVLIEHAQFVPFNWPHPTLVWLYSYVGPGAGVDLFLAISGFVIARSLLPQLEGAGSNYAFINAMLVFWVRRAWRILPSAWLWLVLILLMTVAFNRSGVFGLFHDGFESSIAALVNVADVRTGRLIFNPAVRATGPYWSLSLEEQFYLLLPVAAFIFRRRLPLVLLVCLAIAVFAPPPLPTIRTAALLLGVLLAYWTRQPGYRLVEPTALKTSWLGRFLVVSVLLVSLGALTPEGKPLVLFTQGLVAIVSGGLVFLASYDQDYLWKKSALKTVMLWVGSRSYAIYLIHMPAFLLTREIWWRIEPPGTVFDAHFTLRFLLTVAVLIVVLSEVNYRLVEMPLRTYGARTATRLSQRTAQS